MQHFGARTAHGTCATRVHVGGFSARLGFRLEVLVLGLGFRLVLELFRLVSLFRVSSGFIQGWLQGLPGFGLRSILGMVLGTCGFG